MILRIRVLMQGLLLGRNVKLTLGINCSAISVKILLNFSLIMFILSSLLIKSQTTYSSLPLIDCKSASSYFHIDF